MSDEARAISHFLRALKALHRMETTVHHIADSLGISPDCVLGELPKVKIRSVSLSGHRKAKTGPLSPVVSLSTRRAMWP